VRSRIILCADEVPCGRIASLYCDRRWCACTWACRLRKRRRIAIRVQARVADGHAAGRATRQCQYFPSDEPLRLGLEHFNRGHYGIAEKYYQDAVEKAPRDVTAWVGLAAAYDRIGRFELADRTNGSAR
jgi:Flp pilus assembly protein TadD